MGFLTHTVSRKENSSLFAFIIRESDSAVYNNVTSQFVTNQKLHLTLDEVTRENFRVSYTETRSGSYRVEVDVGNFLDGNYLIQTRFLTDGQESAPTDVTSVNIEGGEVQDGTLNIGASLTPNINLFCYIQDSFTKRYLKADMSSFNLFSITDDVESIRAQFRHSFSENLPGEYSLDRNLASIPDTTLTLTIYYLKDGLEYRAGLPITVHVANGKQQRGVLFNTVIVNHDTTTPDNLRYLAPNGDPIAGADIYIFRKAEYTQDSFDNLIGKTKTGSDGRWADVLPVPAGDTYVVLFTKPSSFGPDTVEITV